MKVLMTSKEAQCVKYARRFPSWEYVCLTKDAFLAGYEAAKQDALNKMAGKANIAILNRVGEEPVEMEFKDGEHQLSSQRAKAILVPDGHGGHIGVEQKLSGAE